MPLSVERERPARSTVYSSQVLDRVMSILNCFQEEKPELKFAELVERLHLHKSTVYRLLEALRCHSLIELEAGTGRYHLGMKAFELGTLAIARLEVDKCARPVLEGLVEGTGETAHLCVLDGSDVVYTAKVESRQVLRIPSGVGRRNPAYCTGVGKAILAFLPEDQLERYLAATTLRAFTPNTIVEAEALRKELRQVRSRGYSVDDEEIEADIRCVGAPVFDHTGRVMAGISVAGPSARLTRDKVPLLAPTLKEAAEDLSRRLGYRSAAAGTARGR